MRGDSTQTRVTVSLPIGELVRDTPIGQILMLRQPLSKQSSGYIIRVGMVSRRKMSKANGLIHRLRHKWLMRIIQIYTPKDLDTRTPKTLNSIISLYETVLRLPVRHVTIVSLQRTSFISICDKQVMEWDEKESHGSRLLSILKYILVLVGQLRLLKISLILTRTLQRI